MLHVLETTHVHSLYDTSSHFTFLCPDSLKDPLFPYPHLFSLHLVSWTISLLDNIAFYMQIDFYLQ